VANVSFIIDIGADVWGVWMFSAHTHRAYGASMWGLSTLNASQDNDFWLVYIPSQFNPPVSAGHVISSTYIIKESTTKYKNLMKWFDLFTCLPKKHLLLFYVSEILQS